MKGKTMLADPNRLFTHRASESFLENPWGLSTEGAILKCSY